MRLFGITGGIGMGKSTAGDLLQHKGLPVVDTDSLARELVEPGQAALLEILDAFGHDLADAQGRLRRDELAKRVFSNSDARQKLESILHPRIRAAWLDKVERWRTSGQTIGFVIIPLLFETSAASHFVATVCVACSEPTQIERLRRRGLATAEIWQRLRAQWPVPRKMEASDFVVWTDTSLQVHEAQWDALLAGSLK